MPTFTIKENVTGDKLFNDSTKDWGTYDSSSVNPIEIGIDEAKSRIYYKYSVRGASSWTTSYEYGNHYGANLIDSLTINFSGVSATYTATPTSPVSFTSTNRNKAATVLINFKTRQPTTNIIMTEKNQIVIGAITENHIIDDVSSGTDYPFLYNNKLTTILGSNIIDERYYHSNNKRLKYNISDNSFQAEQFIEKDPNSSGSFYIPGDGIKLLRNAQDISYNNGFGGFVVNFGRRAGDNNEAYSSQAFESYYPTEEMPGDSSIIIVSAQTNGYKPLTAAYNIRQEFSSNKKTYFTFSDITNNNSVAGYVNLIMYSESSNTVRYFTRSIGANSMIENWPYNSDSNKILTFSKDVLVFLFFSETTYNTTNHVAGTYSGGIGPMQFSGTSMIQAFYLYQDGNNKIDATFAKFPNVYSIDNNDIYSLTEIDMSTTIPDQDSSGNATLE